MLKAYIIAMCIMLAACYTGFAQILISDPRGDSIDVRIIPRLMNACDSSYLVMPINQRRVLSMDSYSDDPTILSFTDGILTPISAGKATIHLKFNWTASAAYLANPIHVAYSNIVAIVTVTPPVIPNVKIDTNVIRSCDGTTLTYKVITDANKGSTYLWRVNGGAGIDTDSLFTSNTLRDGDQLSVTVMMNNRCKTPNTALATVSKTPSIVVLRSIFAPACVGSPVVINAYTANMNTILKWQWMLNGINSGTNNKTFTSKNFKDGDVVTCQVTYKNASGCATTIVALSPPLIISVKPVTAPVITITPSENPVCSTSSPTFTATATNVTNTAVYQWMINGKNAGTNSTVFKGALKNNDTVTCTVTTTDCTVPSISQAVVMKIYSTPTITISKAISVVLGSPKQLQPIITGNIATYKWTPASGLSDAYIANPIVSPNGTTTYKLAVTSTDGCEAEAQVTVNLIVPIVVPSAFTPNGDGINDSWQIPALAYYSRCVVSVYDRNGSMVFHSNGYGKAWDGTINGKALSTGIYYYIINTGKDTTVKGTITIIR